MKWFFVAVIGAIIALLIPAALSGPVNNYFRNDRLTGSMELGPWAERPVVTPPEAETRSATPEDRTLEELADSIRDLGNLALPRTTIALLTIENNTEEVIENIRIRLPEAADVLLDNEGSNSDAFTLSVSEITVPNMRQGDRLVYQIWFGRTTPSTISRELRTFSSNGPIRIQYLWPENRWESERNWFERFLDEWSGTFLLVLVLVLAIGLGFTLDAAIRRLTEILKDPAIYQSELRRYRSDPAKYNPFDKVASDMSEASEPEASNERGIQ